MKLVPDDEAMIYGLDRWDSHKYTYVTEGAIDSMFLPNALAVGGSDFGKIKDIIDLAKTTIILDREPRNKEIINSMLTCVNHGYHIAILPDTVRGKDINEYVQFGYDPLKLIKNNTFHGLNAKLRINEWKKL
jgi:hypothetical protein